MTSWGVGRSWPAPTTSPRWEACLSATRASGRAEWDDRLKISRVDQARPRPACWTCAATYCGSGRGRRYGVRRERARRQAARVIVDPSDDLRQKNLGAVLRAAAQAARARRPHGARRVRTRRMGGSRACPGGLATLDESQKRMLNAHTYPVGLEYGL
ncbi:MAG: hypothetical protein ACLTMP_06670 [Eggerthella lenta]